MLRGGSTRGLPGPWRSDGRAIWPIPLGRAWLALSEAEAEIGVLDLDLVIPQGGDLGDLLLEGHPRQEVGDALFDREEAFQ